MKHLQLIALRPPYNSSGLTKSKHYNEDDPDSHSTQTQNSYIIVHNDSKLWQP